MRRSRQLIPLIRSTIPSTTRSMLAGSSSRIPSRKGWTWSRSGIAVSVGHGCLDVKTSRLIRFDLKLFEVERSSSMATATKTYSVLSIEDAAREAGPGPGALLNPPDPALGARGRLRLRQELGIEAFGGTALWVEKAGANVVFAHDETGPGASGHEELYVIVQGGAAFTVDGDEVAAPHGTVVFVPAGVKREATATEDGTIVMAIGATPGEAFRPSPGEFTIGFYRPYAEKDYAAALAVLDEGLEAYPGNALMLYNAACCESLLGNAEPAIAALEQSVAAWPAYKDQAAG